jgi:hypothetical protein
MTKRFAVFAAALAGLALLAATASASSVQNVAPYFFPTSCGGLRSTTPVVSASESGGLPVQISFGWGALQPSQLDKFLANEYGSITVTDPNGTTVFSDSWDTTNTSGWSPYFQTTLTADGTNFVQGVGTKRFEAVGPLSNPVAGSDAIYHVNMDWELTKTVNDGFGNTKAGPIITLTNCPLIVHNYNS